LRQSIFSETFLLLLIAFTWMLDLKKDRREFLSLTACYAGHLSLNAALAGH